MQVIQTPNWTELVREDSGARLRLAVVENPAVHGHLDLLNERWDGNAWVPDSTVVLSHGGQGLDLRIVRSAAGSPSVTVFAEFTQVYPAP